MALRIEAKLSSVKANVGGVFSDVCASLEHCDADVGDLERRASRCLRQLSSP